MPKDTILAKLGATFPDLKFDSTQYIDEGWDHEILILERPDTTEGDLVFRFPNDEEYTEKLQHEITLLEYLRPKVQIVLPTYTHVAPDKSFAGYPLIPGEQLTRERFDDLSPEARAVFTRQIAGFLSAIHLLDPKDPALAKVPQSYLPRDQKEIRQIVPQLAKELSIHDLELVNGFLGEVDELLANPVPYVFTHGDVYADHLIWNDKISQLGIIDFSDMAMSDAAFDFSELHEYGFNFVKQVYDLYAGHHDDTFLERAWIYQKWQAIFMMTDHFESGKTSFDEARKTFDRVKHQIAERSG